MFPSPFLDTRERLHRENNTSFCSTRYAQHIRLHTRFRREQFVKLCPVCSVVSVLEEWGRRSFNRVPLYDEGYATREQYCNNYKRSSEVYMAEWWRRNSEESRWWKEVACRLSPIVLFLYKRTNRLTSVDSSRCSAIPKTWLQTIRADNKIIKEEKKILWILSSRRASSAIGLFRDRQ